MVYLGGTAPKANIELHDIQFVVGNAIEDTYDQLRENWFGSQKGLHIDSYKEIDGADGFELKIKEHSQKTENKLYFVNLGGYKKHTLSEFHEFGLFVGKDKEEAKKKAMESLLKTVELKHKDNLFVLDDCIIMEKIDGHFIHLKPSDKSYKLVPDWFGYLVISS